jgi:hypothetical protein
MRIDCRKVWAELPDPVTEDGNLVHTAVSRDQRHCDSSLTVRYTVMARNGILQVRQLKPLSTTCGILILHRLTIPDIEDRAVEESPSMTPRPYTMRKPSLILPSSYLVLMSDVVG